VNLRGTLDSVHDVEVGVEQEKPPSLVGLDNVRRARLIAKDRVLRYDLLLFPLTVLALS
jgi:hypothetical protein